MNSENILKEIKEKFKALEAIKLMKFASDTTLTTDDGKTLIIAGGEVATVGLEIFLVDGDGNEAPAPDGDYKISDGSTITVAEGKITVITPVAAAEAEMDDATETATEDAPASDVEGRLTALEDQVSLITDSLNEVIALLNSSMNAQKELMSSHNKAVEKINELEKQPSAAKAVAKKTFTTAEDTKEDVFARVQAKLKKMNNTF